MVTKVFIEKDELEELDRFLKERGFTPMVPDPSHGIHARWRNPKGGCLKVVVDRGCVAAEVVGGWNSLWTDWEASKTPSADPEGVSVPDVEVEATEGGQDEPEVGMVDLAVDEDEAVKGGEEE